MTWHIRSIGVVGTEPLGIADASVFNSKSSITKANSYLECCEVKF